jgi:glutamate dehydrogenase
MDIQTEDFTVVGIGDMSGDVFGNGMLLSRHTRLVAAFNHLDIFLDPDPDPEASYAERERLFRLPRSSWSDYDRDLISEGGGVFSRTLKSIPISPEVREALGIEAEALTPNEVIRAILRAPVDLLYNGGIGTYVKASDETDAEVGDRSNDARRVDADELRCRVVGEGGNLGFTQRARVQYALSGGKIYTDAIDNSAGVDCSDHEVNIKILLDQVVKSGDMTEKQRNALLVEMTGEVAHLVLADNYGQTRTISNAVAQAPQMIDVHARYMRALEAVGRLDRDLEFLPDDEELAERKSEGRGLTAPEFAVLLAYTKLTLYGGVVASDVPEDPFLSGELERYFPTPLRERFREQMREHRLRREIVATQVVNSMVNRAGTTFAFRMEEETGAAVPDITRAYAAAREIFDVRGLWSEIDALDNKVAAETQTAMLLECRRLIERATRWLLRNRRPPLDIRATVERFREGVAHLGERLPELLVDGDREALEEATGRLVEASVPPVLAARVAAVAPMSSAMDVVDVAATTGGSVDEAAAVYFALSDRLRFHWLRRRVGDLPRDDRWRTLARAALRDDLDALQATLTAEILRDTPEGTLVHERVEEWAEANGASVERALRVLTDVEAAGAYDISTLSVALREIRNLADPAGSPARRV